MLKRLAPFLVIAALVSPAHAAAGTTYTFATVDSIKAYEKNLYVTGILDGNSTPSTITATLTDSTAAERCDRLALIAMSKPGKYAFAMTNEWGGYWSCSLTAVVQ
jgi:hypothetical protein